MMSSITVEFFYLLRLRKYFLTRSGLFCCPIRLTRSRACFYLTALFFSQVSLAEPARIILKDGHILEISGSHEVELHSDHILQHDPFSESISVDLFGERPLEIELHNQTSIELIWNNDVLPDNPAGQWVVFNGVCSEKDEALLVYKGETFHFHAFASPENCNKQPSSPSSIITVITRKKLKPFSIVDHVFDTGSLYNPVSVRGDFFKQPTVPNRGIPDIAGNSFSASHGPLISPFGLDGKAPYWGNGMQGANDILVYVLNVPITHPFETGDDVRTMLNDIVDEAESIGELYRLIKKIMTQYQCSNLVRELSEEDFLKEIADPVAMAAGTEKVNVEKVKDYIEALLKCKNKEISDSKRFKTFKLIVQSLHKQQRLHNKSEPLRVLLPSQSSYASVVGPPVLPPPQEPYGATALAGASGVNSQACADAPRAHIPMASVRGQELIGRLLETYPVADELPFVFVRINPGLVINFYGFQDLLLKLVQRSDGSADPVSVYKVLASQPGMDINECYDMIERLLEEDRWELLKDMRKKLRPPYHRWPESLKSSSEKSKAKKGTKPKNNKKKR